MSHRVRKFGTKKSKYEKFWIRTWKCLSVKLKLWTNAEVFISAPIKSSFPPAESAAGSSFCFCCSLIKKGLMRDLFTSYHSPSLAPPCLAPSARLPSMCYVWVSWMENRNGRLQRCPSLDQSLLTWLWQPPFASNVSEDLSAFHPPLAPPPPAYRYGGSGCWGFGL